MFHHIVVRNAHTPLRKVPYRTTPLRRIKDWLYPPFLFVPHPCGTVRNLACGMRPVTYHVVVVRGYEKPPWYATRHGG